LFFEVGVGRRFASWCMTDVTCCIMWSWRENPAFIATLSPRLST
jgi:hypothetical protein